MSTVDSLAAEYLPGIERFLEMHPLPPPDHYEISHLFDRTLSWFPSPQEIAHFYAKHAERAIRQQKDIHLSHKRDGAPFSAEIGSDGRLFLNIKGSHIIPPETCNHPIKLAFDVIRKEEVVRRVEKENARTHACRRAKEVALEVFQHTSWMLPEYYHGVHATSPKWVEQSDGVLQRSRALKFVTITKRMQMDLLQLLEKRRGIPRTLALGYIDQLLSQLEEIHEQGVHRDLKDENVLISEERLAICDFEFFRLHGDLQGKQRYTTGTLTTQPPECVIAYLTDHSQDFNAIYTPAYDMWAAGLMTAELLYGIYPPWMSSEFTDDGIRTYLSQMRCGDEWLPERLPEDPFRNLVCGLLELDPLKRWSATDALRYLRSHCPSPSAASITSSSSIDRKSLDGSSSTGQPDRT